MSSVYHQYIIRECHHIMSTHPPKNTSETVHPDSVLWVAMSIHIKKRRLLWNMLSRLLSRPRCQQERMQTKEMWWKEVHEINPWRSVWRMWHSLLPRSNQFQKKLPAKPMQQGEQVPIFDLWRWVSRLPKVLLPINYQEWMWWQEMHLLLTIGWSRKLLGLWSWHISIQRWSNMWSEMQWWLPDCQKGWRMFNMSSSLLPRPIFQQERV